MGTVSGLLSEPDLEADRYEYYYSDANESVYLDSDGRISIEQNALPDTKPNEVLIKTDYVGVEPDINRPTNEEKYPIVPAGNYVGTVVELGANANSVEVGERVVGGTRFHCGVCSACNSGNQENCENPTVLGVDTDYGAYSRYISVPSDYVYPIPADIDGREATLANLVGAIYKQVRQLGARDDGSTTCVVVGDTPNARLAGRVIEAIEDYSVTQISESAVASISERSGLGGYNIVIEAVGSAELARKFIQEASTGSSILLLGSQYEQFNLSNQDVFGKTIQKLEPNEPMDFSTGITILSEIECDGVLDSTHDVTEFETAHEIAENNQEFSIISLNPDV